MNGKTKEARRNMDRVTAFMFGLVLGGLTGAVTMWLMAPRTGKQTRSQLYKGGEKLRHQAIDGMEEIVSEAGDMAHELTDSVNKGVGELQHHAQDLLNEGKKK
jgi:gas vesicle protein